MTISDVASGFYGIRLVGSNNFVSVNHSEFQNVDGPVILANSNNKLWIRNNSFKSELGDPVFDFRGDITIGDGSTGNINTTGGTISCKLAGTYTGADIAFTDGTIINATNCF